MQLLRVFILGVFLTLASVSVLAEQLDINSANAEQLSHSLKGVGPQKAVAIVQYREQNGPFKTINDLANVKGIGEKVVADNRSRIVVKAPSVKSK